MLNDKIVAATVSKVLIFCLWVPLAALAEMTGPLQQDPVTEDMLAEPGGILDRVYGLGNLRRVADRGADWTDQYWSFEGDSTISVRAIAKYTGLSHWFGYLPGPLGSDFTGLINSGDVMFGVYDNDPETVPRVAPPPDSFSRAEAGDIFRLGLQVRGASGSGPGSGVAFRSEVNEAAADSKRSNSGTPSPPPGSDQGKRPDQKQAHLSDGPMVLLQDTFFTVQH